MCNQRTGVDNDEHHQHVIMLWLQNDKYDAENINDNKDFVKHPYSNLVKITVTEKVNNSSDSKYCDKCECNKLMFVDGSIVEKWLECNQTDEVVSKSVKLARNHQVGTS